MPDFKKLKLSPEILAALAEKGYTTPTPIQKQAIPHLLEGRDLLGIAQTGTGKTAAFALPILDNLVKSAHKVRPYCIRTLILTPTRELASQIAENIEVYGKAFGLKSAVIFGGVSEKPQIKNLSQGLDIVIATPGRLLDLMNRAHVRYAQLEIFVLDEADRMLDMGFINDVKKIVAKLPEKKQTLFFSATMPETISSLATSILKNPVTVEVTPQSTTVEKIDQKIHLVAKGNKPMLLKSILKQDEVKNVLVFSKTKHGANKVVEHLEKHSISVAAIHGNKSQGAREKALSGFRLGEIKVLVATDIAARGIDVPGISHVINYDIPIDPESYVHRIGRTARAGKEGVAISFCDPSEHKLLQAVEKTIRYKIPVDDSHPYHGVDAVVDRSESGGQSQGRVGRKFGGPKAAKSDTRRPSRPMRSDSARSESRAPRSDAPRFNSSAPREDRPRFDKKPRSESFGEDRPRFDKRPRTSSLGEDRPRAPREGNVAFEGGFGSKGKRSDFERKPFADRGGERKNYSTRNDDRKPFGDRSEPRKSFGDKPFFERGDKKPYEKKPYVDGQQRQPYSDILKDVTKYSTGGLGGARSGGARFGGGDRPRPSGDRRFGSSDRPNKERRFANEAPSGNSRFSNEDRPSGNRSFGGGERSGNSDRPFGDRRPAGGGERRSFGSSDRRPSQGSRSSGGIRRSSTDGGRPSKTGGPRKFK